MQAQSTPGGRVIAGPWPGSRGNCDGERMAVRERRAAELARVASSARRASARLTRAGDHVGATALRASARMLEGTADQILAEVEATP